MRVLAFYRAAAAVLLLVGLAPATASAQQFRLVSDVPSGQPVGTTVTWSVVGNVVLKDFRFDAGRLSAPLKPVYGYTTRRQFQWTPLQEGVYKVQATVRDILTGETTVIPRVFVIQPRAGATPVVTATRNPLVALYSAPACSAPNQMQVTFTPVGGGNRFTTSPKSCDSVNSMNFMIAGMRQETTYRLRHAIVDASGAAIETGPLRLFTTGIAEIELPTVTVSTPGPDASQTEPVLLGAPTFGNGAPIAADTDGEIIWYYDNPVETQIDFLLTRTLPGGNMLLFGRTADADRFRLREIDLAGNTVRETTVRWINEQFIEQGGADVIPAFHHEARLLPNGQYILLGTIERLLEDVQGPGIVDVIGDVIMALDEDWNLVWSWNAFDHLDVTEKAILDEKCVSNGPGCPILLLAEEANDWMHANAIGYSPSDGNIVLSVRHLDRVLKIDYQDGQGTGTVVWTLGYLGDFTVNSDDPDPLFSHQHDPNYIGEDRLIIYDNGNAKQACLDNPDDCVSRGQVYRLDENAMVADLESNIDLQNYARAVGSAQVLGNGNYSFNSGIFDGGSTSRTHEVTPAGDHVFDMDFDIRLYRTFRMKDLYTPPPLF